MTSLPTGTGFLANRSIVAALLAGGSAAFLIIGLACFLVIAKRMIETGFPPQVDIGAVARAAFAIHRERGANFFEQMNDDVAHGGPAAVLGEPIVA